MRTLFLSAQGAATLISRTGLAHCIRGMVNEIDHDFKRWEQFDKSARLASHSAQGVIEIMPISDGQTYGFKYVNGHPNNHRHELPTVMAFGVLARVETGLPEFVSELTLITALRTAATSALAAQHLANPAVRSMALIRMSASSRSPVGLMALGARDGGKFESGQASELLTFQARFLERLLRAWLDLPA